MSRLSAENTTSAGIFEAWRMGIFEVIVGEMVRELFRLQGAKCGFARAMGTARLV
jgi:hypothetical protein